MEKLTSGARRFIDGNGDDIAREQATESKDAPPGIHLQAPLCGKSHSALI